MTVNDGGRGTPHTGRADPDCKMAGTQRPNVANLPDRDTEAPAFMLADLDNRPVHVPGESPPPATLLVFAKHDCATCAVVAPLVEALDRTLRPKGLRTLLVSQSRVPETVRFVDTTGLTVPVALDTELDVSDRYGFDAVPALVLARGNGRVLASFEGWARSKWDTLVEKAVAACDASDTDTAELDSAADRLPVSRPGCGSRVHDPDVARRLTVRRGAATLAARRVSIPVDEDPFEFLADQGLTDGLPVVPPTEARVLRMLGGTSHGASEVVAVVPPNLEPATVEKIAVNAVMAGCRPDYLPVVLAAVEAACTDTFNLHGVLATTYFVGPMIVVNGPIRREIGLNCGRNVFGQGFRANVTIGRALQLVVRNIGGGRPDGVDMSTLGQPGKITACIGENEEASCWDPLHVERGFARSDSTVTLFAAEAPRAIRDQLSRSARSLATSMGLSLDSVAHVKLHGVGEALLVVSPEHVRTFERDGFSKKDLRARIQEVTARPLRELLPDSECEKGTVPRALAASWLGPDGQPAPEALDRLLPKFAGPEDIILVVAGGSAGKFSAVVGGWASGGKSSASVTRKIAWT